MLLLVKSVTCIHLLPWCKLYCFQLIPVVLSLDSFCHFQSLPHSNQFVEAPLLLLLIQTTLVLVLLLHLLLLPLVHLLLLY